MIEIALYLGSAIAGWFAFWPWLAVPVLVMAVLVTRINLKMRARMRETLGREQMNDVSKRMMAGSTISTVLGSAVINTVLFLAALGLAQLF